MPQTEEEHLENRILDYEDKETKSDAEVSAIENFSTTINELVLNLNP